MPRTRSKPKFARRFAVRYHMRGDPSVTVRQGFATAVDTAVRSSVFRVFRNEYGPGSYAIIYDRELEIELLHVTRASNGVSVTFTSQVQAMANGFEQPRIRRVK